jgi:hypothetical protein
MPFIGENSMRPTVLRRVALPILVAWLASSCQDGLSPTLASAPPARAFGLWVPGPNETCTKEQHDRFSTVGADGKRYPTWHPPTDPATGCRFGHEHGRDPAGSRLAARVGPIPFGYANEQLETWDPLNPRNEDHVGHKVEWENDISMRVNSDVASGLFDVRCDVLVKLHQGTHSKDAFTNNVHELVYHIACNDGTAMHITMLTAIGTPGEFTRSCDNTPVVVGLPTPLNSPKGGGHRLIPDRDCVIEHMLVGSTRNSNMSAALHESWQTSNQVRTEDGHTLASFDPYFQVPLPSRYYDPAAANVVGRPIDMCYAVEANGDRARGGPCAEATGEGLILGIAWDDPRSPFNGVRRKVDINGNRISNKDGPAVWFTDPYGRNGRPTPFPGSVRQVIAVVNTALDPHGPTIGHERHYGGPGVRAPN